MNGQAAAHPLRRIAIVNRGEPAMRLINAARERSHETGEHITTIALFTEPDRRSMFVREADEAHDLGPATTIDADGRERSAYLDLDVLERALVATRADAAWVGWGFGADEPRVADLCDRLGVTFIGPSVDVMRRVGDRITAKQIAMAAGVPVDAWSGGPVETVEEAVEHSDRIGFPLYVKSSAGRGGAGVQRVDEPSELAGAIESVRADAEARSGNGSILIEQHIPEARHIEVQIVGDSAGTVWAVGVRDSSVQRRSQRLIEETPSPSLDADQHRDVLDAAERFGRAAGYRNVGTVAFLYRPADRSFSFTECTARLQHAHPITEVTAGVDLVKLQLHVAAGGLLEGEHPPPTGHAIEARVDAVDPELDFTPLPGRIDVLRFPTGPGLRIDTGYEEGDEIAAEFDPTIATFVAFGRHRDEATARLRRALGQTEIVVQNGTTNSAFVQELLRQPEWTGASIDVGWIDRLATTEQIASRFGEIALLAAAVDAHRAERAVEIAAFRASAQRGRPEIDPRLSRVITLRHRGVTHRLDVRRFGPGEYRITVEGHPITVHREEVGRARTVLTVAEQRYRIVSATHGVTHFVEVNGQPHRITHDEGGAVRSPAPAVVVSLAVDVGDRVEIGDRLAVIEAMKMETVLTAEFTGAVRSIDVHHNDQVDTGERLMVIEPDRDEPTPVADMPSLSFADYAVQDSTRHDHCAHWLRSLRQLLLGYDLEPADVTALAKAAGNPCGTEDQAEHRRLEQEVLQIFGDVVSLFGREADNDSEALLRHGTEGYLFEYLRRVESRAAGLPESFVTRLTRTLSHFGVPSLDPSPDLDTALARILRSHQRMSRQIGPVLQLLERRLEHPASVNGPAGDERRTVLEDVARASRAEYPAIHDLVNEVQYREFDAPFLAQQRWRLLEEAEVHVEALAAVTDPKVRTVHVDALVHCPQPLKTLLSTRFVDGSPRLRAGLLETMTRRYYRMRDLRNVNSHQIDDVTIVTADYELDDRLFHVAALHVEREELRFGLGVVDRLLDQLGESGEEHVLDVYLWSGEPIDDHDPVFAEVRETLDDVLGARQLHRVAVAVTDSASNAATLANQAMRTETEHLTFRPAGEHRYEVDELARNLHPMMAKRLQLWRLEDFDLTRVDSPDDVYLYHGTARENRRDERLFALAEVRDLTPVRDEDGRLVRLPELERVVHEVAGAMRRYQAQRPPGRRLSWNRIMLSLWPELDLSTVEISDLVSRLAPEADGLDLQKAQVLTRVRLTDGTVGLRVLELTDPSGNDLQITMRLTSPERIRPLGRHEQNVVRLRQRGLIDPYDLLRTVAPLSDSPRRGIPSGEYQEYDLVGDPAPDDPNGAPTLVPVDREPGRNTANIVVAVVTNRSDRHPDGIRRVAIVGDPTRGMGNLAEAECSRINAALDLAVELGVPAEWYAVSAGARIAMDSGSENMDWISRTLRKIIEFTQGGHHLNIVITGISVGAQPYWNAEATMLMHTKGVLIMIPASTMVLTGKDALDYSGGVSAENNLGIGGYERIMGPNGQAQYLAHDVADACQLLLKHYGFTWSAPEERFPRPIESSDPHDRNILEMPHGGEFPTLAELFSETTNPDRKKPFEMRRVMEAVVDQDVPTMERWFGMADAEIPIVWNASLGGHSVCLLGFEAQNLPRTGIVPADGPTRWTSSTLFPKGSKKVARAINATSGNRPLVVLAALAGFDGSPESMRTWQLEFGAEIGRAVVNFDGPIVFCVVSRYHGGAFVVFSGALNDHMEVAALEGSHASVIGGAPAAAVVFARDVNQRTDADPRVAELREAVAQAAPGDRARLAAELAELREDVHADKLGEVAAEFDGIHSVHRALEVGSIDRIIPPAELRPYLIDAVERGIERTLAGDG